jgi:hypothetical protein
LVCIIHINTLVELNDLMKQVERGYSWHREW